MAAANFELGIGDGRHQKKRNASHNFGPKCKATLFALTIIFASVALNSIYMEARLGQIEKRLVKDFERRLDEIKQSFEIDITAETNLGEFSEEFPMDRNPSGLTIELPRQKRQAQPQPTPAPNTGHSGIASARIAILYGDDTEVKNKSDGVARHSYLRMKNNSEAFTPPVCHSGSFINGNGAEWCRRSGQSNDIVQLTGRRLYYNYFAKASWMEKPESSDYYGVIGEDSSNSDVWQKIQVKWPGMYIITSSMRFTELRAAPGNTVPASYGVYINDAAMDNERKVSSCAHLHRGRVGDDGSKVFPCTTWQLVPMLANDVVYMKIEPYVWFEISKDTMFLALINLNDDVLDIPGGDFRG